MNYIILFIKSESGEVQLLIELSEKFTRKTIFFNFLKEKVDKIAFMYCIMSIIYFSSS